MCSRTGRIMVVCITLSIILQTIPPAYSRSADFYNLEIKQSAELGESVVNGNVIRDLQFYAGRIYIGYGDIISNAGRVDAIYYDPNNNTISSDAYDFDECAVFKYERLGSKLYAPGTESTVRRWDNQHPALGNLYIRTDQGWSKSTPIVDVWHMYDVEEFGGDLYVATNYYSPCCAGQGTDSGDPLAPDICVSGAIFKTSDEGLTWQQSYAIPRDYLTSTACYAISSYNNKLYAFPSIRGGDYCLVYYDPEWRYENILNMDNIKGIAPIKCNDKLLLYVTIDGGQGQNPTKTLYAYDGTRAEQVNLTYHDGTTEIILSKEWFIIDYCIETKSIPPRESSKDDLYMLIGIRTTDGERLFIVETKDLQHWNYYKVCDIYDGTAITRPCAIEASSRYLYIINNGGVIYEMRREASTQDGDDYFEQPTCSP